jgi:hypothetical protein
LRVRGAEVGLFRSFISASNEPNICAGAAAWLIARRNKNEKNLFLGLTFSKNVLQ